MLLSGATESLYNFWPIWFHDLSFLVLHICSWGPVIHSGILTRIPAIFNRRLSSEWQNRQFFFSPFFVEVAVLPYLTMASTPAATTTKQQANTDLMQATKSDDEAQVIAATSVLTTKQQPIFLSCGGNEIG
jgi:hypothetical protein